MIRANAILLLSYCCLFVQSSDPQKLFQQAVAAQQRGDDLLALRDYEQLIRLAPEAMVVHANLGALLVQFKRYDEAIVQYRIVLQSDPANQQIKMNLALAFREKGDCRSALDQLKPLHESNPSDLQTLMLLADCDAQTGRYAETVSLLFPLEKQLEDSLDLTWLLGVALIHANRQEDGVERVENVAIKTNDAEAYLMAGETRLDLNQYDLAKRDVDAAISLNRNLPTIQSLKGMVLEHLGDYIGAEAALKTALQADKNDFNAHYYLGAVLYFRRELVGARQHLDRALQLQPQSAEARYELALVDRADNKLDDAVSELETVVRNKPDWLEPHIELSSLYYRLHRPEDGTKERTVVDRLLAAGQRESSRNANLPVR